MTTIHALLGRLRRDEAGEGVISNAIAVLITAFLGAALWLVFSTMMGNAASTACTQVASIGGGSAATSCDGVATP